MWELLGTAVSAVLGGGATGLLGVWLKSHYDLKNKKLDREMAEVAHENAMEMENLRRQALALEVDGKVREAELEAAAIETKAMHERMAAEAQVDGVMRQAALESDKATYFDKLMMRGESKTDKFIAILFALVDACRGLTRPALTLYLSHMAFTLPNADPAVVAAKLYLATTAIVYWFGARSIQSNK